MEPTATEIKTGEPRTCENCWFGRDGDCKLGSCNCAQAVMEHRTPTRWLSKVEVEKSVQIGTEHKD